MHLRRQGRHSSSGVFHNQGSDGSTLLCIGGKFEETFEMLYGVIVLFEFAERQAHAQMGIGVCLIEFKGDSIRLSRGLEIALAVVDGTQTDVGHGCLRGSQCSHAGSQVRH